ncbi:MAG: hypothetical protein QOK39_2232, partial [Acidimicrobiaceae bacterium]|nr:hypothetical protein [Acidimicrobiaceae bacterium]
MSDEEVQSKANLLDRIYASSDPTEIANKAIIARYVDATNRGDLDILNHLVYDDYIEHDPVPGQKPGVEGLKEAYTMFNSPFPDLAFIFDDVICEDDMVFGRGIISGTHKGEFFGVPATGKKVHWTGTRLFRLRDGKVVEGWVNIDMMSLMQQMGVVPTPPGPDLSQLPTPPVLTGKASSVEANRALMTRFIEEVWNK